MRYSVEASITIFLLGCLPVACGNTSSDATGPEYTYNDDAGSLAGLQCPSGTLRCEDTCVPLGQAEELCPKPPPDCDLTREPKDSPACVDERVGVFVSSKGNQNNPGTKEKPLLFIPMDRQSMRYRKRVYVCEGSYPVYADFVGDLDLPAVDMGIYGGFSCEDWSYNGSRPKITGPTGQWNYSPALSIRNYKKKFEMADFDVDVKDATSASSSSVAVVVTNSDHVLFRRISITARNTLSVAPADSVSADPWPVVDGQPPPSNDPAKGGIAVPTYCVSSHPEVSGGKGGDGVSGPLGNGSSGAFPAVSTIPGRDGAGGTGGTSTCQPGHSGADGAAKPAAPGATWGKYATTWLPGSGESGLRGDVGQGGGGGGGVPGHGGSGGGAGGCSGYGGRPGFGAGSSFAIVSFHSSVTLESCTVRSGNAGNGGLGGAGAPATGGGKHNSAGACASGSGGNGAGGGGGGGGAGGLSAGVAYIGTAPAIDASTTVTLGSAGHGGAGGAGGPHGNNELGTGNDGRPGGDGKSGIAATTVEIPE